MLQSRIFFWRDNGSILGVYGKCQGPKDAALATARMTALFFIEGGNEANCGAVHAGRHCQGRVFSRRATCRPIPPRDALLLCVIGSPDPYHKHSDGMGGATSSASKMVILSRRARHHVGLGALPVMAGRRRCGVCLLMPAAHQPDRQSFQREIVLLPRHADRSEIRVFRQ